MDRHRSPIRSTRGPLARAWVAWPFGPASPSAAKAQQPLTPRVPSKSPGGLHEGLFFTVPKRCARPVAGPGQGPPRTVHARRHVKPKLAQAIGRLNFEIPCAGGPDAKSAQEVVDREGFRPAEPRHPHAEVASRPPVWHPASAHLRPPSQGSHRACARLNLGVRTRARRASRQDLSVCLNLSWAARGGSVRRVLAARGRTSRTDLDAGLASETPLAEPSVKRSAEIR